MKLNIDWILLAAIIPILSAGLVTMHSFVGESTFFGRQIVWIVFSLAVFFVLSVMDFRFLRRSGILVSLFLVTCALLLSLFLLGDIVKGAQRWIALGPFSFQPSDPAKLILILILAKYFSRRHIEIAHIRHILISGFYAAVLFAFVLLQPDFGSALIIFFIWLGMVLVSGISKKHLFAVLVIGVISFALLWMYGFEDYQKQRIISFIHPLADIQGAGYNAYQSTIAVGSGRLLGKGIGYGTQSRLKFLPEYETDFIFAAFAEEWGFIGVLLLFSFFGIVVYRILLAASRGATNFETLFGVGLSILLMSHIVIHVGMNIGLLPVTGTPLPFMSYGGSHLLTEFIGLGILMGMGRYSRAIYREDIVQS
jgi:rod shape determining protein RodA